MVYDVFVLLFKPARIAQNIKPVQNCTCFIFCTVHILYTFKEARSVTFNIFRKKYFLFESFVKMKLSNVFRINMFSTAETARKSELSY